MPCPAAAPQHYCTPKPLGQLSVLESRGSYSKFALSLGDFGGRQVGERGLADMRFRCGPTPVGKVCQLAQAKHHRLSPLLHLPLTPGLPSPLLPAATPRSRAVAAAAGGT